MKAIVMPVYNEDIELVCNLLGRVRNVSEEIRIAIVDDGNPFSISKELMPLADTYIKLFSNQGYAKSIRTGLRFLYDIGFDKVITIDADGQHFPEQLPNFFGLLEEYEVVLGSRYLVGSPVISVSIERGRINEIIREELFKKTGVRVSDPFCGFRGFSRAALGKLGINSLGNIITYGYGLSLEIWCRIIESRISFTEIPVELYYPQPNKKFSIEPLQDPERRLEYYKKIIKHYF